MGVQEQRIEGHTKPVLLLPHPLGPGDHPRTTPTGDQLWNPNWSAAQRSKEKHNAKFIQAIVNTTIANAQVCHPKMLQAKNRSTHYVA